MRPVLGARPVGHLRTEIRQTHRYGFRSGDWAEIVGVRMIHATKVICYWVLFPDGVDDLWPIVEIGLEFRASQ